MKPEFNKAVEQLRAKTGYCLIDCKMALIKFDYSMEKAVAYLGSNEWKQKRI